MAKRPIQKGTSGDLIRTSSRFYKVAGFASSQVRAGAITDTSTLTGKVAVKDIPAGQPLTLDDFAASHAIPISPGDLRAVVVKSSNEIDSRIAVGSKIDVWVANNRHGSNPLRSLYRKMNVLAVDTTSGTVTLRATATQAAMLVYVSGKTNDRLVVRAHQ